jgi:hypothetical protein
MSKRIALITTVVVVLASVAFAGETAWFNPSKCDMCRALVQIPGLQESTHTEDVSISNGIVCLTTVDDQHLTAYRDPHMKQQEVFARLQQGEPVQLCGSCAALSQILVKGVKQDYADRKHGNVWVLTSDKPEVAKELQAWATRNGEEMAKLKSTSTKTAKY